MLMTTREKEFVFFVCLFCFVLFFLFKHRCNTDLRTASTLYSNSQQIYMMLEEADLLLEFD